MRWEEVCWNCKKVLHKEEEAIARLGKNKTKYYCYPCARYVKLIR